jgi:hypothetical protein
MPRKHSSVPMEDRIRFIGHRDKKILQVNFSNCSPRQSEEIARRVPDYVTVQARASVLVLIDFTGASFDQEAIWAMKESAVLDKPYIKKSAWFGAADFSKECYEEIKNFSEREFPTFGSREEALKWLAED